jgi:predicted metal-dependent HD superfamily phosphohydrolase
MSTLERWWRRCFEDIGGSEPPDCVWEELQARYSEPHRAYHTLQHLQECFGWFEQVRALTRQPGDIAFALFYHDAIYDTHASDNEAQSAKLAADVLSEYVRGDADAARVSSLIMATKHDAEPSDADACLLVDIDLSILGAEPARFDEYERQIRAEYAWVPAEQFRARRGQILQQLLARPTLYGMAFFRDRLEAKARQNLARSVAALTSV